MNRGIASFIGVLILMAAGAARSQVWDFNEVSLLLPLPRAGEENLMLAPQSAATAGNELLPQSVYAELPMMAPGNSREMIYATLRVVAVRIDPCFIESFSMPCQKQIRLVWQPVVSPRNAPPRITPRPTRSRESSDFTTIDAALHTFHRLSDPEWARLMGGLLRVKSRFSLGPGLPLQVHPILRQQGYRGEFWQSWVRSVLPLIGAKNLVRVTMMTVNPMGNVWVFLGFDRINGRLSRIQVPRVQNAAQAFFSGLEDTSEFRTEMNPYPPGQEAYLRFLFDSMKMKNERDEAGIREALRVALEIDNPALHTTGTVDCASCHASRAVTHWARAHFPKWNWNQLYPREVFKGGGNLTNTSMNPLRTDILRAFGYFGTDPIISSRTIHDTSVTVGQMVSTESRGPVRFF